MGKGEDRELAWQVQGATDRLKQLVRQQAQVVSSSWVPMCAFKM